MGRFTRALDNFDSFLSWWERLVPSSWTKAGVGVLATYVFSYWAVFTEQPPVVIATCTLGAAASFVVLFTYLPSLLKKQLSPSLLVVIHPAKFPPSGSGQIPIFITNRSKHNRVHLEFILHIPLSNGQKAQLFCSWFPNSGFTPKLGPQESTSGYLYGIFSTPQDGSTFLFSEASLHIMEHVSARSLTIKIPGRFPPKEVY